MAIWLYAEDSERYSRENIDLLQTEYDKKVGNIDAIHCFPTLDTFKDFKPTSSIPVYMAPYLPSEIFESIPRGSFFEVVHLPNLSKDKIRTSTQEKLNIPIEEALSTITGSDIFFPKETLADYGGIPELQEEVMLLKKKQAYELPIKGYLLAGIPGTGKSFWVKCVGGELGYAVVPLNISKIKKEANPVDALYRFFKLFVQLEGKYILWIDEIEKMLKGEESQEIIGELLTNLAEHNTEGESSFFVIATANNVDDLAKTNAEFFRDGRWDAVFFLLNPTVQTAEGLFEIYVKKAQKRLLMQIAPLAIYYYAKNNCSSPHITRSEKIGGAFFKESIREEELQEIAALSKKEWKKKYSNDEKLQGRVLKAVEGYEFNFNIPFAIQSSMEEHRKEGTTMFGRYTYTPAEIMTLINRLFIQLYIVKDKQIDYHEIAKGTQPIQKTMKDSVMKMLARSTDFIQI